MNKLASAAMACMVGICCGWRAQSADRQVHGRLSAKGWQTKQAHARDARTHSLKTMLATFLTLDPALAFNPSHSLVGHPSLLRWPSEAFLSRAEVLRRVEPPISSLPHERYTLNRRQSLQAALALALSVQGGQVAHAEGGAAAAAVTDKVLLEFEVRLNATTKKIFPITFGLFGKDAPEAVGLFISACKGTLDAKCQPPPDVSDQVFTKERTLKLLPWQACKTAEKDPITYQDSLVWAILPGQRINAGELDTQFGLRAPPNTSVAESATLSHDAAGLLSVPRGGGVLDFGITLAPTPQDDKEYTVIGRVLEGMEAVAELGALPIVKSASPFKPKDAITRSTELKACFYGGKDAYCAENKPLKKVELISARVL